MCSLTRRKSPRETINPLHWHQRSQRVYLGMDRYVSEIELYASGSVASAFVTQSFVTANIARLYFFPASQTYHMHNVFKISNDNYATILVSIIFLLDVESFKIY